MFENNLERAFRRAGMTEKEVAFLASDPELTAIAAQAVRDHLYQRRDLVDNEQTHAHPATLRGYYDKGPDVHLFGEREMAWDEVLRLDVNQVILTSARSRHDAYEVLISNRLKHKQIHTIKDLLLCNKSVLGSIKNIGVNRLVYIQTRLRLHGLRLTEMADIQKDQWINPFSARHPYEIDADCLPYESFLNLSASFIRSINHQGLRLEAYVALLPKRQAVIRTVGANLTLHDVAQLSSFFKQREFSVAVE
jgi:hypothetical protein